MISAASDAPGPVRLTVLNSMAGDDFEEALDTHLEWGLRLLDLKNAIFGKPVMELNDEEANRAAEMIAQRRLQTYCLSTGLFNEHVGAGEAAFRERHLARVERATELARALDARKIRLLAAQIGGRDDLLDSTAFLRERHPWLFELYREAIDRIHAAGFETVIENEVGDCFLARPQEVVAFFEELDRPERASFTWDVQNLWQMGTFPTMQVYRILKPCIGMLHLKGGRAEAPGTRLRWATGLEQASWPVEEIVRAAAGEPVGVGDGVAPVICLNPSHGEYTSEYPVDYRADLEYLRTIIPECE